jgi:hypothetical protein
MIIKIFNNFFISLFTCFLLAQSIAARNYSNSEIIGSVFQPADFNNHLLQKGKMNFITIKNLSAEDYILTIKSAGSEGLLTRDKPIFSFFILTPIWKTWWFDGLLIVVFLLLARLIYSVLFKRKVRRILEYEQSLVRKNEQIKGNARTDFCDELEKSLLRIPILCELVKRKLPDDEEIISLLNKTSRISQQLYHGTKDFIWVMDPYKDSLYELMVRLKDAGDDLFSNTDIQLQVNGLNDKLKTVSLDIDWRRYVLFIFREAMNNSLYHAKSRQVFLESAVLNNEVEISLVDDGIGFNSEKINSGDSIKNMTKFAEKIYCTLKIESRKGIGTKVTLKGRIRPVNPLLISKNLY